MQADGLLIPESTVEFDWLHQLFKGSAVQVLGFCCANQHSMSA